MDCEYSTVDCICMAVWSWDPSEWCTSSLASDLNTFGVGQKRSQLWIRTPLAWILKYQWDLNASLSVFLPYNFSQLKYTIFCWIKVGDKVFLRFLYIRRCSELCLWPTPEGMGTTSGVQKMAPTGQWVTAGPRCEQTLEAMSFNLLHVSS